MEKQISCGHCKAIHTVDLAKYGGKKIKCPQCQTIIVVPVLAAPKAEFEVVGESPSPPQPPLHQNRMASQRGAVNVSLLLRKESSRAEIRNNFLSVHGGAEARQAAVINAATGLSGLESELADKKKTLEWFKSVYSRANAVSNRALLVIHQNLTNPSDWLGKALITGFDKWEYHPSDEDVYPRAVELLGGPVAVPAPVTEEKKGLWKKLVDTSAQENERKHERMVKLATLKAAIEKLESTIPQLEQQVQAGRQGVQQIGDTGIEATYTQLQEVQQLMQNQQFSDASAILQLLIRSCPVEMIGEILVLLSKTAFLTGNATQSAQHIQDAICFGASSPTDMGPDYNDLWGKAAAGLPKT